MPRLTCFAHNEVSIVVLLAFATLVALFSVRIVALLTETLCVLEPVSIYQVSDQS